MAKDGKTERATPRRRKQQKEKGSLAKSKELTNFLNLLGFLLLLMWFGKWFVIKIVHFQQSAFELVKQEMAPLDMVAVLGKEVAMIFVVVVAFGTAFQAINYFVQVGLLFSPKIVKPDIKRINPANYFKQLFSRKSVVEVIKALFIFSILATIVFLELRGEVNQLSEMILIDWLATVGVLWDLFVRVMLKALFVLGVIGTVDYIYQRWEHEQSIKMKKNEVKDEHKETQGNPQVKSRQRQAMMQMLRNEVASKIPNSTVVITNPTHYAVAIRYNRGEDAAPTVTAKGVDHLALYIRQLAEEHEIPVYEAPPLARELYARSDKDEFIPKDLYEAVILILIELSNDGKINI